MCRHQHILFQWMGGVGTWICIDSNVQFFHCSVGEGEFSYLWIYRNILGSGNCAMHGPNHLVFQLFGRVGTSLCMDPTIQLFNCLVEWELPYVWTQPFSFSIVWQSGNFAMYGPNHLVFQLFGRVGIRTSLCMDPSIQFFNCLVELELRYVWTQPFSFSIAWGSGNLDMYGQKHLVYQLFGRGRGEIGYTRIYLSIQLFNCFGEWELRYVWPQTFSFSIESWSVNLDMYGSKHLVFLLFQKLYVR